MLRQLMRMWPGNAGFTSILEWLVWRTNMREVGAVARRLLWQGLAKE